MGRKQRVIIGFAGIGVCVFIGAISVEGSFEPGQVIATIAGILFFIGAYKAIFFGKPSVETEDSQARSQPIQGLERRLADIQEIVISIDDRLRRIEQSRDATPQEKPQI